MYLPENNTMPHWPVGHLKCAANSYSGQRESRQLS